MPRTVGIIKSLFNVKQWFDWERIKAFTLYLKNGIKKFFVPQQNDVVESFAEAKARLDLSDEDLLSRQKALYRLSLMMVIISVLLLFYAFYNLYLGSLRAFYLSLVVMLIGLVLAFRYHFWYFQIKKRKLGCSLKEWYRQGLLGEKR